MASPAIEDRTIYLDRYTTSAGWSLDLAGLMCPTDSTQPSAVAITAGNGAGHFTNTSGVLTVSATGDSADLSSGTYSLTIQGTWSTHGSATNTATPTPVPTPTPAPVPVDPLRVALAARTSAKLLTPPTVKGRISIDFATIAQAKAALALVLAVKP